MNRFDNEVAAALDRQVATSITSAVALSGGGRS